MGTRAKEMTVDEMCAELIAMEEEEMV